MLFRSAHAVARAARAARPGVRVPVHADVLARVDKGNASYARIQLAAMKRVLDREEPDYKN